MASRSTRRVLAALPKTELHLHLDGSLSADFISRRAAARGLPCPPSSSLRAELHARKTAARARDPRNSQRPGGNWGVFEWCNQFLQTRDELWNGAREVCDICAQEGVLRTELRFCPVLHTLEDLTAQEAVEAVVAGVRSSQCQSVGVIICALRSHPPEHSMEMARLAEAYVSKGVVGFDIAGDEGSFPLSVHRGAVEYCKRSGIPVTVHAGEWPGSQENIALALELGVDRIGHGWAMASDPDLMARAAAQGVTVEVCLTSNVKPDAKEGWVQSYASHPVRKMFEAGVRVALSSDNFLLSGGAQRAATPSGELQHLVEDVGFSIQEAIVVLENGIQGSFLSLDDKESLASAMQSALDQAHASHE